MKKIILITEAKQFDTLTELEKARMFFKMYDYGNGTFNENDVKAIKKPSTLQKFLTKLKNVFKKDELYCKSNGQFTAIDRNCENLETEIILIKID